MTAVHTTANAPLASILIRSMDRPTLSRALDSAAAQTWPNLEIVVVAACGAAHRALPAQWKGRPLRLIFPQPDQCLPRSEAANLALESACGEWLNFLDDDDELLPDHIATLLGAPRSAERVLYSNVCVIDAAGVRHEQPQSEIRAVRLYFGNFSPPLAVLFHRSLIDEGVRFDPAFAVYEDHDFHIALALCTRFRFVEAVTALWYAASGDSGCGTDANYDPLLHNACLTRIREKWQTPFLAWLQNAGDLLFTAEKFAQFHFDTFARECLDRVLRLRPGDSRASQLAAELTRRHEHIDRLLHQGQKHLVDGALREALACFDKVLDLRPGDVNALNLGGMALLHAGRFKEAERALSMAAASLPQHEGIQKNLRLLHARRAAIRRD